MTILLLIAGIILFIGLVVVHEYGHFIAARRNGVEAEEFSIFFPPRIYKRRMKGGWLFSIGVLPLGGFVKLKGEHDSDTEPGSFGAASVAAKTKIMAAGVLMNLVAALVILTIVALLGMPKLINNQFTVKKDTRLSVDRVLVGYIEPGSPADKAGLKSYDELMDIALPGHSPVAVKSADALPNITKQFAGQTVDIYYVRNGHNQIASTTLNSRQTVENSQSAYEKQLQQSKLDCATIQDPKAYLGISPRDYILQQSTWSAPIVAAGFSWQVTKLTFAGLGHALAGLGSIIAGVVTGNNTARANGQCTASSQVTGPVGIFYVLKSGSLLGYQFMLLIIGIISLTLAIMNILPVPALDGGRLWLLLASRAIRRPLSARAEETITAVGFFVLIALMVLITLADVHRFF